MDCMTRLERRKLTVLSLVTLLPLNLKYDFVTVLLCCDIAVVIEVTELIKDFQSSNSKLTKVLDLVLQRELV